MRNTLNPRSVSIIVRFVEWLRAPGSDLATLPPRAVSLIKRAAWVTQCRRVYWLMERFAPDEKESQLSEFGLPCGSDGRVRARGGR